LLQFFDLAYFSGEATSFQKRIVFKQKIQVREERGNYNINNVHEQG